MQQTFDSKIDYYEHLGVPKDVSSDDLKNAYLTLIKEVHPDIVGSTPVTNQRFRQVQQAYNILSDSKMRTMYDNARFSPSMLSPQITTSQATPGFNVQKDNYNTRVRREASSNWRELKNKYKTEKWQNLSLNKRKSLRARPVTSLTGVLVAVGGMVTITGGIWLGAQKKTSI